MCALFSSHTVNNTYNDHIKCPNWLCYVVVLKLISRFIAIGSQDEIQAHFTLFNHLLVDIMLQFNAAVTMEATYVTARELYNFFMVECMHVYIYVHTVVVFTTMQLLDYCISALCIMIELYCKRVHSLLLVAMIPIMILGFYTCNYM